MGVLSKVFGSWFGNWRPPTALYHMGIVNTRFNREAYEHAYVRAIIDCIATHAAKATATHVIVDEHGRVKKVRSDSPFTKLLNSRPNELMTGFDLRYKLITQLESHTTAVAYIKWDKAKPVGIYPVNYRQFEAVKIPGASEWAALFTDPLGDEYKLPLEDCVVLRKFYNQHDVYGDGNKPVYDVLDLMKATDKGLADAVTLSNKARILHKKKNAHVSPLDKENNAESIAKRLEKAAAAGGVMTVDASEELSPINFTAYSTSAAQMTKIEQRLLTFWRISSEILQSNYTEPQWQSFYESVIEPLLIMLGQAFTNACFTQAERDKGNRIIFSAPMLLYASLRSKILLLQATKEGGFFTTNEIREMLGYPPVEGGDKRQVSLNYVNADKQDNYQSVKEDDGDGDQGQEDADAEV